MVYCGRPSRGCQMCRSRRIRCDETKPTCKQCIKSRRQCPGYKDDSDLIFRNETKATERRAQKANRQPEKHDIKQEACSPTAISIVSSFDSTSPTAKKLLSSPSNGSISPLLSMPTDLQASCHFFSNFILVPREGSTRGFMDYLVPLMKDEPSNSHLTMAFNACALSHLGNRVTSADSTTNFGDMALTQYTKALSAMHMALKDPDQAKSDATLAAVLLLGLYENISAKNMGMYAWGSHIEGAISLVKQRGRKQLRTKTGLALFIAVRTQMIIHHITSAKPPPKGADWWLNDAVKDTSAAACQMINIKCSELRAEVTQVMTTVTRTAENVERVISIMRRAQAVDQDCVKWTKEIPDNWKFKTVTWEDSVPGGDYSKAEVFPGRVDVYSDYYIASVWNLVRVSRLILASVIVRCAAWACSPVDYRTTPEYATASRTCVDTITDVIASVPYHLGWHLKPDRKRLLDAQLSGFACGNDDSLKGLSGYFVSWPLASLQCQDYTTDAQRVWLQGRLKYIAEVLGVNYAQILSQLNIRIPSMLIRRDGMMAQPYPMAHDFMKLLTTARAAPPTPGYTMNPIEQRKAMLKEKFEVDRHELLSKATGRSGPSGEYVAKHWLSL